MHRRRCRVVAFCVNVSTRACAYASEFALVHVFVSHFVAFVCHRNVNIDEVRRMFESPHHTLSLYPSLFPSLSVFPPISLFLPVPFPSLTIHGLQQ